MRFRGGCFVVVCLLAAGCAGGSSSTPRGRSATTTPRAVSQSTTAGGSPASTACSNASAVSTWTLQRRVSFLVVAPVLNFDLTTVRLAAWMGAGGVLFLGGAAPPAGLGAQLRSALSSGAGPPPAAMADEEGGGIQRLTGPVVSLPWARTMASTMSTAQVESLLAAAGSQMRSLDIAYDLAPVADVDAAAGPSATDPDGQRSFSGDPAVASEYAVAYGSGLMRGGVIPVVKHFPGLGGASGNTDNGPATTPPFSTLETRGLVPFRAAVAAGAPAVMVSNASVPGLTSLPASLAPAVVSGLLRSTLGFHGLVLTDSLSAGAIAAADYDVPRASVAAVAAGADMVLFGSTLTPQDVELLSPTNVGATFQRVTSALVSAVDAGGIPVSRIDGAVEDVLAADHVNLCGG
ncbi:MAG TPA: glycoside hydrolase family 3 N-terminal domain-containing protein [Acidimicrobiales bacterium]|nr:glycoside hydrolase family 3 N-terminal domain-containing protein [Acidimicrobiales bacterium]